jgi:hypothetical protein
MTAGNSTSMFETLPATGIWSSSFGRPDGKARRWARCRQKEQKEQHEIERVRWVWRADRRAGVAGSTITAIGTSVALSLSVVAVLVHFLVGSPWTAAYIAAAAAIPWTMAGWMLFRMPPPIPIIAYLIVLYLATSVDTGKGYTRR